MTDWTINDDDMRAAVLSRLTSGRDDMIRQAERAEREASDVFWRTARDRRNDMACARYSRRAAEHFQQAIDLLTAAPMPPESTPQS